MAKSKLQPVLLNTSQIQALRRIQEQERSSSPLGIAPTIHVIARQLMDKALREVSA
ncbi:hypothetical protein [Pseudomonas graminis]